MGLAVIRHDRLDTAQVSSGAQYCYIRALEEMEGRTGVTIFTRSFTTLPQGADEILGDILTYGIYRRRRFRSPSAGPGKGPSALIVDVRHLERPGD